MTRSERVFGPSNVQDAEDASAREKCKQQVMIHNPRVTPTNMTQPSLVPETSSIPDEVEKLM